jgi:hypothetical protein
LQSIGLNNSALGTAREYGLDLGTYLSQGKAQNLGDVVTDADRQGWTSLLGALGLDPGRLDLLDSQDEGGAFGFDKDRFYKDAERVRQSRIKPLPPTLNTPPPQVGVVPISTSFSGGTAINQATENLNKNPSQKTALEEALKRSTGSGMVTPTVVRGEGTKPAGGTFGLGNTLDGLFTPNVHLSGDWSNYTLPGFSSDGFGGLSIPQEELDAILNSILGKK